MLERFRSARPATTTTMQSRFLLTPFHLLVFYLASWINREQLTIIEYLQTENRVLRELLGNRRLLLTDDQRRRLAVKGKALGRKLLGEVGTLFTPDTILRWHRQLVAEKWNYSHQRKTVGRPATEQTVVDLVVKLATENPRWGYDSLVGRLANLGHALSASTVKNILKQHGIEPAPERTKQPRWKEFLAVHWGALAATDFFSVEVRTQGGLVTYFVLFVIDIATRRVQIAGITNSPSGPWMKQVSRQLTDPFDGFLLSKKYLIMDRDGKFAPEFQTVLKDAGVAPLLLPPQSPNLNAYAERFVRSIKEECLDKMIFFGEPMLRETVLSWVEHYHAERNHQGLNNQLIDPIDDIGKTEGETVCRQRLGGMLKFYHRRAA
jgi:transposase InsO family protein